MDASYRVSQVLEKKVGNETQAVAGGEVWSYGRSNSDVQKKMLNRLQEYEEDGAVHDSFEC